MLHSRQGGTRFITRLHVAIAAVAIGAVLPMIPIAASPAAAATGSQTFGYTGGAQYFTAPTGVTELQVEAWGAQGDGALGGRGGYVRGILTVTPGQTIQVNVGGGGMLMSGGWNGGGNRGSTSWSVPGGGGGASDVRGTGFGVSDRLIVAGGGGGQAHSAGGDGGWLAGTKAGDNGTDYSQQGAEGGYGGEQSNGGAGGFGWCGSGSWGSLGSGGAGGSGTYGGGGGGGGYYGGGGGGAGCNWGGAAGGGGSSWVDIRVAGAVYDTGVRVGHGQVKIAWTADAMAANIADTETRPDGVNNTGDAEVPFGSPTVIDPNADPQRIAATLAREAELEAAMPYYLAHYLTPETERSIVLPPGFCIPGIRIQSATTAAASSCPPGTRPPDDPATKEVPLFLHQQSELYTCAPNTGRTVLQQITGIEFPEATLAAEMGTRSSDGTMWDKISPVLNAHQDAHDFFGTPEYQALTPDRLMGQVMSAVLSNHSAMLNVNQTLLGYWERKVVRTGDYPKHYNTAYGYNLRSGGSIFIGDGAGGKPYGTHVVPLQEVHEAVVAHKGLVIR